MSRAFEAFDALHFCTLFVCGFSHVCPHFGFLRVYPFFQQNQKKLKKGLKCDILYMPQTETPEIAEIFGVVMKEIHSTFVFRHAACNAGAAYRHGSFFP